MYYYIDSVTIAMEFCVGVPINFITKQFLQVGEKMELNPKSLAIAKRLELNRYGIYVLFTCMYFVIVLNCI